MRFCPVYHSSSTWSPKSIHKTDGSESESHSIVSDSLLSRGLYSPWNSPGQNTGVRSLPLHQGIFPTQGSNPDLPHCRWILYELNHKGSPGILEWVVYPFSRGSSRPRNWTRVSYRRILYQLGYQGSLSPLMMMLYYRVNHHRTSVPSHCWKQEFVLTNASGQEILYIIIRIPSGSS